MGGYEKFTGHYRNPGKSSNGKQRPLSPVYDCRDCRKRIGRDEANQSFESFLQSLEFVPNRTKFKKALTKVWRSQQGSLTDRLGSLSSRRQSYEQKRAATTAAYVVETDESIKSSLGQLLREYEQEISRIDAEVLEIKNADSVSEEFVRFAIEFVENIREGWWQLSWENMQRGEQILFNGKIYMDNTAKVHPTNLSSIYRLGTNKKALSNLDNAHLVELAGTAPASKGLAS